jgi:uncharacterized protein (TIGR00369 family)
MPDRFDLLVRNFVQGSPQMRDIGLEVTHVDRDRSSMSMPARPDWMGDPARDLMHPGAITVLADSCCGLAVGAALDTVVTFATLDLRMDYLRPASPSRVIHCDAHCYRISRSIAFARAEVHQGDRDEPVAAVQAVFMLSTPSGSRPAERAGNAASQADSGRAPASRREAAGWQPPPASEPAMPRGAIPYLDYLGIRVAPDAETPTFRLPFDPKLIGNPRLPALHGGVLAGFAESAALLHLNQTLHGEKLPKGIDFSLDYLRGGRPEETFANCDVVRLGKRVALVQVRLWQREPEVPIAVARAHCLLTAAD